jgi:putative endonuclease
MLCTAKAARRSFGGGGHAMQYVYLLRSAAYPARRYIGRTSDLHARIRAHNSGRSPHTAKYTPWRLVAAVAFEDERRAIDFERYLKTGSGRSFANRHFWPM